MTVPAALQTHYNTGSTSMANALLIRRQDGELYGFTSNSVPFTLDLSPWDSPSWPLADETAFAFDATQGLVWSDVLVSSGFAVSNANITTLNDGTFFNPDDIRAGRWRGALWRFFRYRWDVPNPTIENDVETLLRGDFGEITLGDTTITVELRALGQRLQQPVGIVSQRTCRVRLGSQGPSKCNVDLAPFTHALTVTSKVDNGEFACSAATQGEDYFGEGLVTWTSGNNVGLEHKVREFEAGVFTLVLPTVLDIQVGDTLTAVAGCRKRHETTLANPGGVSDCKTKFNNVLNFQGEPHRPTTDDLTRPVV